MMRELQPSTPKSNFQKDPSIQQDGRKARHGPSSPLRPREALYGEQGSGGINACDPLQAKVIWD